MRLALIIGTFLPFAFYGVKDNSFHFRGRKVSAAEHFIHFAIGVTQVATLIQAVCGNLLLMFTALVLMMIVGAIDEYIFHRGLPAEESDLHAKQHLALLIFVVITVATTYLERNSWKFPWPA